MTTAINILNALGDIKDEYILHAMNINRKRVMNIRRVLIAAVIVVVATVCALTVTSDSFHDLFYQSPTNDAVESALNIIENQIDKDYAITVEVYGGMVDEEETERILSIESWGEIIEERGWSTDTFAIVYMEYYVEYNHDLSPYDDGYTAAWFWMEKVESSGEWLYYDSRNGIEFRGIFEPNGHSRWTKDDVAAYNAATTYLEENFSDVEIFGYKFDYSKALEVIRDYPELAEERDWHLTQIPSYDYTFYVVYVEYCADYENSAVWLWMEKDEDTGEWACYKADTDVELEYVYVTREAQPDQDERAQAAALEAIEALAEDESIESVCIYGSKVDSDQTRLVLIDGSNPLAEERGWSRADKTFYIIYAEYQIIYSDGGADDVIASLWMERDTETNEWSCYSMTDITATKSRFLYKDTD